MENEVKDLLEEGVVDEVNVNRKPSKLMIFGGLAAIAGLLIAFRKKINAKIESNMVKKLTKKGYTIYKQESIPENDFEESDE